MLGTSEVPAVARAFERAATEQGDRPALIGADGEVLWTFSRLADGAARLAHGLHERGIGTGDRVLAMVSDPRRFALVAAGVFWAGATLVIPPRSGGLRQRLRAVAQQGPRAVVVTTPVGSVLGALGWEFRPAPLWITVGRWHAPWTEPLAALLGSAAMRPAIPAHEDPALISFTSGTTAFPKPIVRTYGVLGAQHGALEALRPAKDTDVDLVGLPLLALHNLSRGVPSVLPPAGTPSKAGYGRRLAAAIRRNSVTTAAGFPALFESMVRDGPAVLSPGLRSVHLGGDRVRPELVESLLGWAPTAEIVVVYGSTEAEPVAAIEARRYLDLAPRAAQGDGTCVGAPLDGVEVKIERPGQALIARSNRWRPDRGVGHLLVRGDRVAVAPPGEWLDTGDTAWADEEGRLWLMGRRTNLGPGGLNPGEVESAVESLDWVGSAALMEAGLAVEPRHPSSRAQRGRWRADVLELGARRGWSLPSLVVGGRIPRHARTGKVDYERLAHWFSGVSRRFRV